MINVTTVDLEVNGRISTFPLEQADRLLRMGEGNGGWHLPKDSEYRYDVKNGIRRKPNTRNSKEPQE